MSQLLAAEMKNMTTQQVVLILGLAGIVSTVILWLAIIGKDPVDIFTGLAPILLAIGGAFGWAKVTQLTRDVSDVKDLSNGRLTEVRNDNKVLQREVKDLNEKIAALSVQINPPEPDK